jgi:hypothetical protein
MTITLTDADRRFTEAIRAVVAEAGRDHVYELRDDDDEYDGVCEYVRDDQPSCLIAQALARVGVPVDVLARYENRSSDWVMEKLGERYPEWTFSRPIIFAARQAQIKQDQEKEWGEALDAFERGLVEAGVEV